MHVKDLPCLINALLVHEISVGQFDTIRGEEPTTL